MAGQTASAVRTMTAATAGLVVVLAPLSGFVGLGPSGWLAALAFAAVGWAALTVAMRHHAVTALGPADLVTLTRAVLVGGVCALVVDATERPDFVVPLVVIASVALAMDALDGRVARRTGTASPFGARFDMEVDAFLILVLSAFVATRLGPWVVAIGLMRYVFVAAARVLPWLAAELPPGLARKTVAAAQGVALVVAASGLLPEPATLAVVVTALAALTWSFAHDVGWLYRHRAQVPALAGPTAGTAGRRWPGRVATGLAGLLVLFAMVAPNELSRLSVGALARVPLEGIVVAALLLVLGSRARTALGVAAGVGLGLLTIVKLFDMGFNETLARPFDLVFDWSFLGPGLDFVGDAAGPAGAVAAVAGAVLLAGGLVFLMTRSVLRLSRLAIEHRTGSTRAVSALGVVWLVSAVLGLQLAPGAPLAATTAATEVYDDIRQVRAGLLDPEEFAREAAVDAFRHTPGDRLLTSLRGKDVIVAFVESYGRVAIENSVTSAELDTLLARGDDDLRTAGFASRSAFLESSTSGGGSWLAHATLQSGLWIDNQRRYDSLVAGDRLTLSGAFRRAGWRTVGVAPAITKDWPESEYFGYDTVYHATNVGYRGPTFAYAKMPDQFTLDNFERRERGPDRPPVMAEIDLVSSHSPWAPLPSLVDWDEVGDGSVFDPQPAAGTKSGDIWPDPDKVRQAYGDAIGYSLSTVISYLRTHGDDDLVLVVLGDHQPAPIVTGPDASWDVPISIVTRDHAVLDDIADWAWEPGLNPSPRAPVWRMDEFRDRFLTAFGPESAPEVMPVARPRR